MLSQARSVLLKIPPIMYLLFLLSDLKENGRTDFCRARDDASVLLNKKTDT